MGDRPEIEQARAVLEAIRKSVGDFAARARRELEEERQADIASGKKGKTVSQLAVYSRAIQLHKGAGGKTGFTLYEKHKLVNVHRVGDGNRAIGGYVGGRNHRKDFYLDDKGKLCWQPVSMMEANDRNFTPKARQPGNRLLWSAHKEDTLLIDDPDDATRRIRVVVAKFGGPKMGVVPIADARVASSKEPDKRREIWEYGLKFFAEHRAQRVVTDALGEITWRFPVLPVPGTTSVAP